MTQTTNEEIILNESEKQKIITAKKTYVISQNDVQKFNETLKQYKNEMLLKDSYLKHFESLFASDDLEADRSKMMQMLDVFLNGIEYSRSQQRYIFNTMSLRHAIDPDVSGSTYAKEFLEKCTQSQFAKDILSQHEKLPCNRLVFHYYFMYHHLQIMEEFFVSCKYDPFLIKKDKLLFHEDSLGLNAIDYFCLYLAEDKHILIWDDIYQENNTDNGVFRDNIYHKYFMHQIWDKFRNKVIGILGHGKKYWIREKEVIWQVLKLIQKSYYKTAKGKVCVKLLHNIMNIKEPITDNMENMIEQMISKVAPLEERVEQILQKK